MLTPTETERLKELCAKLSGRTISGDPPTARPGYKQNVAALRAEIARLQDKRDAGPAAGQEPTP